MQRYPDERNGIYCSVLSELKSLGVKVPKVKKFKAAIPKQEKSIHADCRKIFGVCLCDQDKVSTDDFLLPKFIVICTSYLKDYCDSGIGLFRKAGSLSRQRLLRDKLEKGESIENSEPNDVASLLKQWLRELPESLIPSYLHDLFIRCQSLEVEETKMAAVLLCCHLLPPNHLHTLKYLLEFLSEIARNSDKNKMDAHNLALIMAPNIFVMGKDSIDKSSGNLMQQHTSIMELLIIHAHKIGEIPPCSSFLCSEPCGSNLDTSSDMLDLSPTKSKKKQRTGPVQGLLRKLVGQDTPANSSRRLQDDPKSSKSVSRSASKRKADPEVVSLTPAKKQNCGPLGFSFDILNVTPNSKTAQNVLRGSKEKSGAAPTRRKSFGLLKRKKEKRAKSAKMNLGEDQNNCLNTPSSFSEKLSVSFEDCLEGRNTEETPSPLLSTSDIDRILSRTSFVKKSLSDCQLSVTDKEFKDLPALPSSTSQGFINDVKNKPLYNLRSNSITKRPIKRKSDVINPNLLTPVKSKENSFPGVTTASSEKIRKLELTNKEILSPKNVNIMIDIEDTCIRNKSLSATNTTAPSPSITRLSEKRGSSRKRKNHKLSVDSNRLPPNFIDGAPKSETHVTDSVKMANSKNATVNENKLVNSAVLNVKRASKMERKASLTRQDAFIIKHKKNAIQVRSADSTAFSNGRSRNITKNKNENSVSDLNDNIPSKEFTEHPRENVSTSRTPENKKLRRNLRNGSIVRGRPNTIKTGLPSAVSNRFNNDSASVNAKKVHPSTSLDDVFNNDINHGPKKNDLDVSITTHIQNLVLSTPPESTSISNAEEVVPLVNETVKVKRSETVKDALNHTKHRSRTKVCSNSDSQLQISRRKSSKVSRTHSFPNPRITRSTKSRKKLRAVSSLSPKKFKSASKESEKENICLTSPTVNNSILNNDDLSTVKPASSEEVWVSGEKFKMEDPAQDDVFNKRESICMILKNSPGHVLAKVQLYDTNRNRGAASHIPVMVSYSTPSEMLRGSYRNSIRRRLSERRNASSLKSNKSAELTDSNLQPPKVSFPLKELTNISNGGDISLNLSPVSSPFTSPIKGTMNPYNLLQDMSNQNLVPTTTTYIGHTPYKIPRVFRAESSPL